MSGLVVKRLDSLAELRNTARLWDELWERSEITLPSARAALVALWCESFAADQPFRAFVVERDGQAVAALPLVESKWKGLKIGLLPGNHWSPSGDLLLDPTCDAERICGALLRALKQHAWPLLWFGGVPAAANRWQAFFRALEEHCVAYARRPRFMIDLVEIRCDWDAYLKSLSRNHRRHMRKSATRAERAGTIKLACYDQLAPEEVEPLLKTCFEIEARGWKGRARSAVLNVPGAWEFYLRQAKQLAAWGQLNLTLLTHEARPIAFEYGWRSQGVYFSPKVGYDEAFHRFSPGQLLRFRLLGQFHEQPGVHSIDFLGPSTAATSKWATDQYSIDRVVVAARGPFSRAVVAAYRHYGWLRSMIRSRGPQREGRRRAAAQNTALLDGALEECEGGRAQRGERR
ncbi:MAG: GNAT family N-acetyltransferase [Planctomycetia bacterium]|nr:GNAT family N-acetyltransferase [Planctomycetia bacterium]